MRAYELEESAVDELKNRLPKLKSHSYDTIDHLMQDISVKHKITGKKLHDLFVHKYGHTPDTWIKKIKNKLGEEGVTENFNGEYDDEAGMAKTNLYTIARATKGLLNTIDDKENLPEWVQEKIAKVEGMMVSAWDYLASQEEQGINPEQESIQQSIAHENKRLALYPQGVAEVTKKEAVKQYTDIQNYKPNFKPKSKPEPEEFLRISVGNSNQKKNSKISEAVEGPQDIEKIKHFIKLSYKTLNMQKPYPKITISKNTEVAQAGHHTGVHKGNDIWIYVGNRNLIDIFRTIFHELTHHRQMQLNMIKDGDSYPGSPIEMLADMAAGKYIKFYGKEHPEIFQ